MPDVQLSGISVINPIFGVYKSDGESVQFIIDLRYINKFMKKYKFKLEKGRGGLEQ